MEPHETPLFLGCARDAIDAIVRRGERRRYDPDERVLRQGEAASHVFLLLGGVVRVLIADRDGQEITAKLFSAPAVFGEMETLTRTPFIESVVVLRRADILRFDRATFDDVLQTHAPVARNLLIDVCHRFRTSALNQAFAAFESVERRLANLLASYARSLGVPVKDGTLIVSDSLTHEELARGIGVNEKSIRRTLKAWEQENLVTRDGRSWLVRDLDTLAARAGDDAPRLDYRSVADARTEEATSVDATTGRLIPSGDDGARPDGLGARRRR